MECSRTIGRDFLDVDFFFFFNLVMSNIFLTKKFCLESREMSLCQVIVLCLKKYVHCCIFEQRENLRFFPYVSVLHSQIFQCC